MNPNRTPAQGKVLPCPWCSGKAFAQSPSLGHSSRRVVCDDCCAEGPTVPSYNVEDPEAFCIIAWNNRAGNVAMSTWDHYAEEHVDTRPLPQPSEDQPAPYTCKHSCERDALMAQIAKMQADSDKLAGAATALRDDMLMRAEMHKHRNNGELVVEAGNGVWRRINAALTEWKDRASG